MDPFTPSLAWRAVSPRLVLIVLLRIVVQVAVVGLALLVVWVASRPPGPLMVALGSAFGLIALVRAVTAIRAVRSWGYLERDEDLLVRHGLLVRRLSIVPYARMQFVDVTAGPLERLFKLATVTMHTAAAASDAQVPGLPFAEASRLRDRLAKLGEDGRAEGL